MNLILILGSIALANAASLAPPSNELTPPLASAADVPAETEAEDDALRGLYVPDNIEQRFDDGSYVTEPTPLPLVASPYGLVPSGSGLEGHYVPDGLEKLYDDGLYRAELIPTFQTPLIDTPYGKVAAGSGLEGQYFTNNTEETFDDFDDGSYKFEDESENV